MIGAVIFILVIVVTIFPTAILIRDAGRRNETNVSGIPRTGDLIKLVKQNIPEDYRVEELNYNNTHGAIIYSIRGMIFLSFKGVAEKEVVENTKEYVKG